MLGSKVREMANMLTSRGLISLVNGTLFTEHRFACVSRSRRFGMLLGVIYDRDSKQHQCRIESIKN